MSHRTATRPKVHDPNSIAEHASRLERAAHSGRIASGFRGTNSRLVHRLFQAESERLGHKPLKPILTIKSNAVHESTPMFIGDKSLILIKGDKLRHLDLDTKSISREPITIPSLINTECCVSIADQERHRVYMINGFSFSSFFDKNLMLTEYSSTDHQIKEKQLICEGKPIRGAVLRLHIDKDHNLHMIVVDTEHDNECLHYKLTENQQLELVARYDGDINGFVFIDDKLYYHRDDYLNGNSKLYDASLANETSVYQQVRQSIHLPYLAARNAIPLRDCNPHDNTILEEIISDNKGRLYCHCRGGIYVFKRNPIGSYQYEFELPLHGDLTHSRLTIDKKGNVLISHHPPTYGDAETKVREIKPTTEFYYIPHNEIAELAKAPRLKILADKELNLTRQQKLDPERTQLPSYKALAPDSKVYKPIVSSIAGRINTGLTRSNLIPETNFYYSQGDEPACGISACLNALEQLDIHPAYAQMAELYKMGLASILHRELTTQIAESKIFTTNKSFVMEEFLAALIPQIQTTALRLEGISEKNTNEHQSIIQSNAQLIKECLDRGEKLLVSVYNEVFKLGSNMNAGHGLVITGYEINKSGYMDLMIVDSRLGPICSSLEHLSKALPPKEAYKIHNKLHYRIFKR